jgi:hypothetical protein
MMTSPPVTYHPSMTVFASRLRNLHTLSLLLILDPPPQNLDLSNDVLLTTLTDSLSIEFHGIKQTIKLPCSSKLLTHTYSRSKVQFRRQISDPRNPSKTTELSATLPLNETLGTSRQDPETTENITPWPAETISRARGLSCRKCNTSLLLTESVSTWRNLPHDDWAEMMDLWHCHKPHTPTEEIGETIAFGKGYSGANGGLVRVQPGVGCAGSAYVLVSREDTELSVNVSPYPSPFRTLCGLFFYMYIRTFKEGALFGTQRSM